MKQTNTPQGSLRSFYIKNPKETNEQECYKQGLYHLKNGDNDLFRVHWHGFNDGCPFATFARGRVPSPACYEVKKEDLA